MTAQEFLPREPEKLPTLPLEIPAHAEHGHQAFQSHTEQQGIKTLLSWHAPGRPFRKRSREFYLSGLLIMLLLQILAFLFGEYFLMAAMAALTFLAFVLYSVPPHNFHYRISVQGLTIEDHFFLWEELYDFYFKKRDGLIVLHIRTRAVFPGELTLTLGDMDKEHIRSILMRYLPYREVVIPTFMEKSGDWLARNFPLEKPKPQQE